MPTQLIAYFRLQIVCCAIAFCRCYNCCCCCCCCCIFHSLWSLYHCVAILFQPCNTSIWITSTRNKSLAVVLTYSKCNSYFMCCIYEELLWNICERAIEEARKTSPKQYEYSRWLNWCCIGMVSVLPDPDLSFWVNFFLLVHCSRKETPLQILLLLIRCCWVSFFVVVRILFVYFTNYFVFVAV